MQQIQTLRLAPGETQVAHFSFTAPTPESLPQTFVVTVTPGNLTDTFTVVNPHQALIIVDNLTVSPREVAPGDVVTIGVSATNYGDAPGEVTITVTVTP